MVITTTNAYIEVLEDEDGVRLEIDFAERGTIFEGLTIEERRTKKMAYIREICGLILFYIAFGQHAQTPTDHVIVIVGAMIMLQLAGLNHKRNKKED